MMGPACSEASPMGHSSYYESEESQHACDHTCWICFDGHSCELGPLQRPCRCPRLAHRACLARWQLQQAGRREEHYCRFCDARYPDWRPALTPPELHVAGLSAAVALPAAAVQRAAPEAVTPAATQAAVAPAPVMAIYFNGRVHRLRVPPGPEAHVAFQREVRALLGLPQDSDFEVTFECRAPTTGETLLLQGMAAFDAAAHCAAVSAARRVHGQQSLLQAACEAAGAVQQAVQQQQTSPRAASPLPGAGSSQQTVYSAAAGAASAGPRGTAHSLGHSNAGAGAAALAANHGASALQHAGQLHAAAAPAAAAASTQLPPAECQPSPLAMGMVPQQSGPHFRQPAAGSLQGGRRGRRRPGELDTVSSASSISSATFASARSTGGASTSSGGSIRSFGSGRSTNSVLSSSGGRGGSCRSQPVGECSDCAAAEGRSDAGAAAGSRGWWAGVKAAVVSALRYL